MGAPNFEYLKTPIMFSFQFMIETVSIFAGENQNIDPLSRYVIVEEPNVSEAETNVDKPKSHWKEIPREGKKKGKGKNKGKAKKKGKGKKNAKGKGKTKTKTKTPIKVAPPETPTLVPKRKQIFLPPFRISLRFFFNRTATVDQIELPDFLAEATKEHKDTKPINNLAFDKGKKGKGRGKGKKGKKGKKGGKGKKKGKQKIKKGKENVKPQVIPREPSIQWVPDDHYSPEELSWRLPSEETFRRGLSITFPATAEQMILWLQRGPFKVEVDRWKGYGEKMPIGTASLDFDSSPFIERIVNRSQKAGQGFVSCRDEDEADIFDLSGETIGVIKVTFFMICYGGTVISENLISEKGVFDLLNDEAQQKNEWVCPEQCGYNYAQERMGDRSMVVVPNAVVYENSPIVPPHKYKEYAEALYEIFSSNCPIIKFGQCIEGMAGNSISPEDMII